MLRAKSPEKRTGGPADGNPSYLKTEERQNLAALQLTAHHHIAVLVDGGGNHASGHDDRARHRQVGFPGSRRNGCGEAILFIHRLDPQ
jgi:hypothetical protein